MLSKGGNNEIFTAWSEGNDPNASVFGALDPADQPVSGELVWGVDLTGNRAAKVD